MDMTLNCKIVEFQHANQNAINWAGIYGKSELNLDLKKKKNHLTALVHEQHTLLQQLSNFPPKKSVLMKNISGAKCSFPLFSSRKEQNEEVGIRPRCCQKYQSYYTNSSRWVLLPLILQAGLLLHSLFQQQQQQKRNFLEFPSCSACGASLAAVLVPRTNWLFSVVGAPGKLRRFPPSQRNLPEATGNRKWPRTLVVCSSPAAPKRRSFRCVSSRGRPRPGHAHLQRTRWSQSSSLKRTSCPRCCCWPAGSGEARVVGQFAATLFFYCRLICAFHFY